MKTAVVFALCATLALPAFAGEPAKALLLIDIQDFYFQGGALPLVEPEAAAKNAARLLAAFRAEGKPVVHVRHESKTGGSIRNSVAPIEGEKVFTKTEVSCFNGTQVLAYLREIGVERLVIVNAGPELVLGSWKARLAGLQREGDRLVTTFWKDQLSDEQRALASVVWQRAVWATLLPGSKPVSTGF